MSQDAINELIQKKIEPIISALGKSVTDREEMLKKIEELEASEQDLKNKMENYDLNNTRLIDESDKIRLENAQLLKKLDEMELSGQIKELEKVK